MNRRSFLSQVGSGFVVSGFSRKSQGYKRKYEPVNAEFDVGAVYIPFVGDKFGRCFDQRKPAIGYYDMMDSDAVNYHIDIMQGFGISTLMFNFGEGHPDLKRFRQFRGAELANEIDIEAFWVINRVFQRDLDLEKYLDFMREEMFSLNNYSRYQKQPVVQCWATAYLRWHQPTREYLREEYGSLQGFINYVRDRLSVNGRDPYLIAHEPAPALNPDFANAFDGYTTWFGPLTRLGQPSWGEFINAKEKIARRVSQFARSNGKDYLPMAVPGFDDRANTCWGGDRYVPRSSAHLADMFELADRFRTRKRINIATFNGWPEGHQIEPGRINGQRYGTEYLEKVKRYVISKKVQGMICESATTGPCISATAWRE